MKVLDYTVPPDLLLKGSVSVFFFENGDLNLSNLNILNYLTVSGDIKKSSLREK